jgi:hypothetical protein
MTRLIPMTARPMPKGVRSSLRRPGDTASMLRFSARATGFSQRSGAHVRAKGSISSHYIGSGLSHCHEERGERKPNHRMALLKDKAIG